MGYKLLEKDIQLAICDYLALHKYFFWRQNTTSVYDPTNKRFRSMPKYSKNGVPDIILIKDGMFIGLEVKRPTGKISDSQKEFQDGVEKVGGQYHVVTCIEDVQRIGL